MPHVHFLILFWTLAEIAVFTNYLPSLSSIKTSPFNGWVTGLLFISNLAIDQLRNSLIGQRTERA